MEDQDWSGALKPEFLKMAGLNLKVSTPAHNR